MSEENFQMRVGAWMESCFGEEILTDKRERNFRFGEEAIELLQAAGCPKEDVIALVDYVYGRKTGQLQQEIGGVMVCLAALCIAHNTHMARDGEVELTRCWQKIDRIRAKHQDKVLRTPHSPLPGYARSESNGVTADDTNSTEACQ